eukprot:m.99701 g.99701  ORF g.99701 m.99701 type:complete len:141 (+) comp12539_c0_seq11:778-1200(+)
MIVFMLSLLRSFSQVAVSVLSPFVNTKKLSAVAAKLYVNWTMLTYVCLDLLFCIYFLPFFLIWLYVLFHVAITTLVIRDLTLRSAASFGLSHLMRLLCDEYIFYTVEHIVSRESCDNLPSHSRNILPERQVCLVVSWFVC